MQKTTFIWDLDGTLLDSYEAILSGIEETFGQFSIPYDKEKVREFILTYSVQDLLEKVAEERNLDAEVLNQVRVKCWLGQIKQGFCSLFIHIRETMLIPF